jgi:hypothetical protein
MHAIAEIVEAQGRADLLRMSDLSSRVFVWVDLLHATISKKCSLLGLRDDMSTRCYSSFAHSESYGRSGSTPYY